MSKTGTLRVLVSNERLKLHLVTCTYRINTTPKKIRHWRNLNRPLEDYIDPIQLNIPDSTKFEL